MIAAGLNPEPHCNKNYQTSHDGFEGALSVAADELYDIAQAYGPRGIYFFPVIGPRNLWDAWVYVFSGLGARFFLATLSVLMLQRGKPIFKTRTSPQAKNAQPETSIQQ